MRRTLYRIYKKFEYNKVVASLTHFIYGRLKPFLTGKYRPAKYIPPAADAEIKNISNGNRSIEDKKVAVICDDMTYKNLKEICEVCFLTPDNWIEVMQKEKPDLFFCESAWSGIQEYKDAWRGKIYKNQRLLFENRTVLLNILDYCRRTKIKTVFWNKEDPYYFNDICHSFRETALLFDAIFTTAAECVKGYQERGHSDVYVMQFGFSPRLYDCSEEVKKENKAVFAGSWYADHLERCEDMEKIFDMLIAKGISLEIYDRHWKTANPLHRFPDKYSPYIHPAVPYEMLGEIYKTARFAININTQKGSDTMYARRVHELMACRCVVISNESKGMRARFGNKVWFLGEPFDFDHEKAICADNYAYVMEHCTNAVIFKEMFAKIGC